MTALPKVVNAVSTRLLAAQEHLKQFNGGIALAFQKLEAERFRRNIETGARTRASTERLARAQTRLERERAPFDAAATNIQNTISAGLTNLNAYAHAVVKWLPGVDAALQTINGDQKKQQAANNVPIVGLMQDIASGKHGGKAYRPVQTVAPNVVNYAGGDPNDNS